MKNEMRIWLAVIAALSVFATGFTCGPVDPDPCEADRFGCDDNPSEFQYDDSCTLTGELEVEVGQGDSSYAALTPGEAPEVYSGSQGGQHIFAAVRVTNAATDVYDKLSAWFVLETEDPNCTSDTDATDASDVGGDVGGSTCYRTVASRQVILGSNRDLTVVDGAVEEHAILLQVSFSSGEHRLRVDVEDPCRRTGSAIHTFVR